jgi:hypothetical protein
MSRGTQVNLFGVGYGNAEKSLNVTASSRVNCYYDIQPAPGDKSQIAVFGTPGLSNEATFWNTTGSGPVALGLTCTGLFAADKYPSYAGTRVYGGYGDRLYIASSPGGQSSPSYRSIIEPANIAAHDFAHSGDQLAIACGTRLYYYDESAETNGECLIGGFSMQARSVTFMDGYFIAGLAKYGTDYASGVYVSSLYDVTSWSLLDFAVPEYERSTIIAVRACAGVLYVFSGSSTEVWQNIGAVNYPFQRIEGAQSNYGLINKESLVRINNTLVGVFKDTNSNYSVYSLSGTQFSNITPPDLQYELNDQQSASPLNDYPIYAWSYSVGGHDFYVMRVQRSSNSYRTYFYDMLSGTWGLMKSGNATHHYGIFSCKVDGVTYVADYRANGKMYSVIPSLYEDDGTANRRELIGNHIFMPDRSTFTMRSMSLDMEHGVDSNDLTVYLSLSRDGGHTFGEEYSDTSTSGNYTRFFQFNRLGRGRDIVPKIRTQDPCKFVLIGAVADIAPYGW